MLGWLLRLLVIGGIAAGVAFAASKLMNRDEDFDDFDDLDDAFEFQETPVEIEVPARDGASGAGSLNAGTDNGSATGTDGENGTDDATTTDKSLQSVSGIGSAYASRLNAININTLDDLAAANASSLNEQFDVPGGIETLEDWIGQAKELISGGASGTNNGRDNS